VTEEEQIAQAFADDERAIAGEFGAAPPGGDEHEIAAAFGDSDTAAIDATFGKPRNAFDTPEARAWTEQQMTAGGLTPEFRARWEKDPTFWTPEDTDNAVTYGPPLAALAVGNALPAMGAVGTLASGVLLGAGTRGATAALRDEDPLTAALDPWGVGLDATLSGIPLWAPAAGKAAKYGWEHLPSGVREPIADAAGWTAEKAGNVASRLLRSYAEGTPTERLGRWWRGRGAPEALPQGGAPPSRVELQPVLEGHNIHDPSGGEFSYRFTFDGKPAGTIGAHDNGSKDVLIDWFDVDPSMQGTPGLTSAVRRAFLASHPEFETYSAMRTGGAAGGRVIDRRPIGAIPSPPRSAEPISTIPLTSSRRIIEDRPVNIEDIFTGRRPEMRPDLVTERIEGIPSTGARTRMDSLIDKTAGEVRLLRSLGYDNLADEIELANNTERRLTNYFGPMTDESVLPLVSGPAADASTVPLSTRVVDVVEGAHPITGEGQGAQAARFADMLRRPDVYDPEIQRLADPMRREMADLAEAGTRANVFDELKGKGSRARAMELHDQGVTTVPIGGTPDDPARWFAERQLVQDGRYYPHQPVPDPLAPDISEATGIERIMTANPELSYRQAQRQLGALRAGAATGKARLAEEGVEYNKYAPEVIPAHVRADATRIANAYAFGGKPVKIKVSVGNGGQEIIVGERAAANLADLANRGEWRAFNAYEKALAGRHMQPPKDADLSAILSGTARMALPRAFLTQIGQMPTGAIMHGGIKGMARGFAEVEANPALRDIFRVGAQSHEFTDYAARAVGENAVESAAPFMKPAENALRGPASYVAVPMIKDTAQEAAAMISANQPFSRALVKRAAEMGTTPEALGAEYLSTDGVLSHATWLDTIQRLTNRWQHTQGVGEIPSWARTQGGATAAQFKTFGLKQSQLIYDDILQPIIEGIRTGDKSLRDLGLARLARTVYMGVPANMGAAGLRTLASGRMPTWATAIRSGLTGPTGIVGDVGYATADTLAGHRYGDDEFRNVREIPGLSVPIDTTRDLLAAFSNPGGAAEAAARLGGLYDSRIPLYATPVVNVAREFLAPPKR